MKFLREPLVHFLLIGGLLFAVFAWSGQADPAAEERPEAIVISPGLLENLRLSFTRQNGHAPDAQELEGAIEAYVREEILNREARALGIDRDDPAVRRWLVQRMEFLTEDSTEVPPATEEDLKAFFAARPERFKRADGRVPEFAEVRTAVQRAWQDTQRRAAIDAAYQKLRARYQVTREPAAGPAPGVPVQSEKAP